MALPIFKEDSGSSRSLVGSIHGAIVAEQLKEERKKYASIDLDNLNYGNSAITNNNLNSGVTQGNPSNPIPVNTASVDVSIKPIYIIISIILIIFFLR